MISLQLDRARKWKVGEVVHLKVIEILLQSPGRWLLKAEDVTPLSGAEPTGYGCGICGIIEAAKPDGSLPDGWTEKEDKDGSHFVCSVCGSVKSGGIIDR